MFVSLFFLSLSSSAQIAKGSVSLGGSVGFGHASQDRNSSPGDGKSNYFNFSPAIGKAIRENLIAGITLNYGKSKSENFEPYVNYTSRNYGAGLFIRRFYPIASHFYFFNQADLGYQYTKSENEFSAPYYNFSKSKGISLGIQPGLSYNVTKAFYLEMGFNNLLQISYVVAEERMRTSPNPEIYRKTKSFSLNSSLINSTNLNIGVRFIIPQRHG